MKIQEVKPAQVNEDLANWVGDYGASRLRQLGARMRGQNIGAATGEQRQVMDMFIRNMVGDAIMSLNTAIQSGLVTPPGAATASPANPPRQEPTIPQPAQPTATARDPNAAAKAKAAYDRQKKQNQDLNFYVKQVASELGKVKDKNQQIALTKELVNVMADRKNYPEWQNAVASAQQIIKRTVKDPTFANNAITRLKSGQVMTEAWQVYFINKLLEAVNLTWKDIGLVLLKENKKNGKYILADSKYYKLNNLFEGIVNEAMSVSQYLKDRWLPNYASKKGISIAQDMADLEPIIADIEKNWNQDQGKTTLPKLGNMLFSIYKSQPAAQKGAASTTTTSQPTTPQQTAQPAGSTATDRIVGVIQNSLTKLKSVDPAAHAELIKKIGTGQAMQNPAPTPTPTSESIKTR